ncbi:MAG: OmpA family protein [gamma proteobacterium symbiont of Taylorina sp.]|nr:OmpA family protein [gamma proteobacterium symbiont of Taylorina sp.]
MNSYNDTSYQSSQCSIFPWIISLILFLVCMTGSYYYLQVNTELKKSQKQKQRIQRQYSQKTDELYESWNKVQESQNKNYQLKSQIEKQQRKIKQTKENLKVIKQKDKELSLCKALNNNLNSALKSKENNIDTIVKKMTDEINLCQTKITLTEKKLLETSLLIKENNSLQHSINDEQIDKLSQQINNLSTQMTQLQASQQHFGSIIGKEKSNNVKEITALSPVQNNQLTISKEESEAIEQIKNKLSQQITDNQINIAYLTDGIIEININNTQMFRKGEVQIIKNGSHILQKIASLLQQFPSRKIQIIGHTDTIPVRSGGHDIILSNWELSAFRSAAVIRYLQHAEKIAPQRMILVGASQYQPLEKGNKAPTRAKNRRIVIRLLPKVKQKA